MIDKELKTKKLLKKQEKLYSFLMNTGLKHSVEHIDKLNELLRIERELTLLIGV